ncbi:BglG family transcription antiterminator [Bacillus salipaludis]|uniref:BglG family transcription antiterminator n=1 Tax=Bacillus salipaludis TaxID=2547811 RepID=UPI002E1F8E57|nr:BglG family transcription antiterminator [Bacillus salipaludis]
MNEKEKALIQLLSQKNDWVKADILATHFSVSTRTIRKYVNAINSYNSSYERILSSKLGYKINLKSKIDTTKAAEYTITPKERLYNILKQAILQDEGMDIFDVSEELFVSVPTIESDLKKAKSLLDPFNLTIKRHGNIIHLNGSERNKRKLMSQIFYNETNNKFLIIKRIQEDFDYELTPFKEKLQTILEGYNLNINEYTVGNILLHIVIAIERVKNHYKIQETHMNSLNHTEEHKAAIEIAQLIYTQYGVQFDEIELYYLNMLLISNTTLLQYDNLTRNNLNRYIEEHYIDLVEEVIQKVNEYYLIDFHDDEFLIKFTLHIRNLINRAKLNYLSKNPLTNQIKLTYPLIYDLAVFISNQIQKREQITINEDEIAYIAFHIGSFFERQNDLQNKLTCTVICPQYYNMHMEMVKKLNHSFEKYLEIDKVMTSANVDLSVIESDLIITTVDIPREPNREIIRVNPFLTEEDIGEIYQFILRVKKRQSRFKLRDQLINLFDPHLFQQNVYLENEFAMIKYMGEKMVKLGFIEHEFIDDVMEREKMSSTAFNNNVAVPHSLHMDAIRSSISILINEKSLKWGKDTVQIVALIAINKNERKIFRDVYDSFIRIISEPENVHRLLQSKNYEAFIETLLSLMEN